MMLFSWTGAASPRRITAMLEQYHDRGIGGVFVIPRTGYWQGYLEPEWWETWAHALKECQRLGMQCNIYDEFFCPSGYAGGHVVASRPGVAREELVAADVGSLSAQELGRAVTFCMVEPRTLAWRTVEREKALAWARARMDTPSEGAVSGPGLDRPRLDGPHPGERFLALVVRPCPPKRGHGWASLRGPLQPGDDARVHRDDVRAVCAALRRSLRHNRPVRLHGRAAAHGPSYRATLLLLHPDGVPAGARVRSPGSCSGAHVRRAGVGSNPLRLLPDPEPPVQRELRAAARPMVRRARPGFHRALHGA